MLSTELSYLCASPTPTAPGHPGRLGLHCISCPPVIVLPAGLWADTTRQEYVLFWSSFNPFIGWMSLGKWMHWQHRNPGPVVVISIKGKWSSPIFPIFKIKKLKKNTIYCSVFGRAGSSLLHTGFLYLRQVGAPLELWCSGFSLRRLLLWSTASRARGLQQLWFMT